MSVLRIMDWERLSADERGAWLGALRPPEPEVDVGEIVAAVRTRGDDALRELTLRLDGVDLSDPWLPSSEWASASVEARLEDALVDAASAIRRFHADQRNALRQERRVRTRPGVTAWRRWQPIDRAGGYVPGGSAAYASSVLMLAIPAKLAGVREMVIATPPRSDGSVSPSIVAAARIGGVDRILKAGGAQAVAAMAYGTESIARVDKLFGAGNAWVTAAKRAVSHDVAIDLPAGPSECVVVADGSADPELVALDLLAQAEHGPDSIAILVTDDADLARAVDASLEQTAAHLATGGRAVATLRRWGGAAVVRDLASGVDLVNDIAAEHVSLQCADAQRLALEVRNAGAIFIGPWSAIAAGDYATGTNHVLPTGAAARAWSGVGVEAFGRWIEVQQVTAAGARGLSPTVEAIAEAEGLPAHGASVRARAVRADDVATDDPIGLLRRPGAVAAYPAEPSDEELARRAGVASDRVVRADMNTLAGGALPAVAGALGSVEVRRIPEYGDLSYARLRGALAARLGIDPRRIVPGAGADELIRLVTGLALAEGDAVVVPVPTFAMFAVEARIAGARVIEVPRSEPRCRQDPAEVRATAERESARLVWVCSPNNPTGDAYTLGEIRTIADGLQALVCVDEVYLEFGEESADHAPESTSSVRLQDELPNVLVLRSLAKSHGLAGARVGYLVVPDALAERLDAVRLPLSVGSPSEALALAALADEASARERRSAVIGARNRLAAFLEGRGCEVLPSVTNFVAFRPPIEAEAVDAALLTRGVAVRRYDSGPMAGWLRATARLEPEEGRLLGALGEVLA